MPAVMAESVSLSPNLISFYNSQHDLHRRCSVCGGLHTLTARVSFSFTIGITPMDSSSENVLAALRYCVLCSHLAFVSWYWTGSLTHIYNVISRQKNLGDRLTQLLEELVPQCNQPALADSCDSLVTCQLFSRQSQNLVIWSSLGLSLNVWASYQYRVFGGRLQWLQMRPRPRDVHLDVNAPPSRQLRINWITKVHE